MAKLREIAEKILPIAIVGSTAVVLLYMITRPKPIAVERIEVG